MIINLYSPSAGCVQCTATKRFLDQNNIAYSSHVADDDPHLEAAIRERAEKLEGNSFPFIQVFDTNYKLVREWQGNRPDMLAWLKEQVK